MIVYISGPYSSVGDIDQNIKLAREAAIKVWETGNVALCPHLNTANFEEDCRLKQSDYIDGDLELLARCDAILMVGDWEHSCGAMMEFAYAESHRIPVYCYPDTMPEKHTTEKLRPRQVKEFIEIVMRMYRVHLDKNQDYSPANIIGTGQIGLVTRIWDKVARLMNLSGFKIELSDMKYEPPCNPKNESIDDTLLDLSVYGIIAQIFKKGVWGK